MSNRREFIKLKGTGGQIEHKEVKTHQPNNDIGFKCLHYSVIESAGTVDVTIVKKTPVEVSVGVRTVDGSAKSPTDYKATSEILNFAKN